MFSKQSLFFLFLPIILLSFAPLISAVEDIEQIYSNWVPRGGNFTADTKVFQVQSSAADGQRVAVSLGEDMVLVLNSSCEELGNYFICYQGTKFLEYDKTLDKAIDQFNIIVKKRVTKVEFTKRTASKEDPYLWEEIDISTRFENTGIVAVKEINFSETPGKGFIVVKATTCKFNSSHVWWKGAFPEATVVECQYTIKPVNITKVTAIGTIVYTESGKSSTLKTEALTVDVKRPMIQLNSSVKNREVARIGKEMQFAVMLTNEDTESTFTLTKFEIRPENGLIVSAPSRNLEKDGGVYRYAGRIPPEGKVRLNMTITPEKGGTRRMEMYTLYFIGGKRIDNSIYEVIDVEVDTLNASIRVDNATLGKDARIRIMVMNYGYNDQFSDIKAWVTTPIEGLEGEHALSQVLPKSHKVIVDGLFPLPEGSNLTFFPVNVDLEYHTIYGQALYRSYNFTIEAMPETVNETVAVGTDLNATAGTGNDLTSIAEKKVIDVVTSKGFKITLIVVGIAAFIAIAAFLIMRIVNRTSGERLKSEIIPPPINFEKPNKGGFLTEFENHETQENGSEGESKPDDSATLKNSDSFKF